eukprot:1328326-Amorphochlora_amoeboformis.AAC.3
MSFRSSQRVEMLPWWFLFSALPLISTGIKAHPKIHIQDLANAYDLHHFHRTASIHKAWHNTFWIEPLRVHIKSSRQTSRDVTDRRRWLSLAGQDSLETSSAESMRGLANRMWTDVLTRLEPPHTVVDATCGNGHDSAYLASLLFNGISPQRPSSNSTISSLVGIDVDPRAIGETHRRLQEILGDHLP